MYIYIRRIYFSYIKKRNVKHFQCKQKHKERYKGNNEKQIFKKKDTTKNEKNTGVYDVRKKNEKTLTHFLFLFHVSTISIIAATIINKR